MRNLLLKSLCICFSLCLSIACAKDEEPTKVLPEKIEIVSFSLSKNEPTEVSTETQLYTERFDNLLLNNHGIYIYFQNELIKKIDQGELSETSFKTTINGGLIANKRYKVFPFVKHKNAEIYGDTIEFENQLNSNIKITEIYPLNGFIYDTITIKGENFCKPLPDYQNYFSLGNQFQYVIQNTDSTIKAVIMPNIERHKLSASVKSCNISTVFENLFSINLPVLDSLESKEVFAGENKLIFGENFHAQISHVWINEQEAMLNLQRTDTDLLEITIPDNLPSGLLDLKIQVLDTIIEKTDYFPSTTPYITEIDKRQTGYLDTLTIKGDYFLQNTNNLQVLIGNREQRILKRTKNELKVIIDKYFEELSPKLVLKTGKFEIEESITMLPPEILSVDKSMYHLADDTVTLKTKYFIAGSSSNITIGGTSLRFGNNFENVDNKGNISLPLTDWLETDKLYSYYAFQDVGVLDVTIKTIYGSDNQHINIYAPKINSINNYSFSHGDYIELNGLDFGYQRVTGIYIDNELVTNPGNSTYTSYNKKINFEVPENIASGDHTLKVKTGGQFSNEINFNIKKLIVTGLSKTYGVREIDTFTVNGSNLEHKYGYTIRVNDFWCDIINSSENHVSFKLPYHTPITENTIVNIHYGPEIINAGTINGQEPYSRLENYQLHPLFHKTSTHFEHKGKLYFFNHNGIFQFNEANAIWETFEASFPFDSYSNPNGNKYISTVGDKIYIPYGSRLLVYNMTEKIWESPIQLSLGSYGFILYSFMTSENEAFLFTENQSEGFVTSFIKYNLSTHTIETVNQPNYKMRGSGLGDEVFYANGKIYFDPLDQNIQVYDTNADTWEDIGFPKPYKYHYKNNLYVYNNVLYLSGGFAYASQPVFDLYAYDLTTKVWTQKTPMLFKAGKHAVWGHDNFLYFGIGFDIYSYENLEMIRYDINSDPY